MEKKTAIEQLITWLEQESKEPEYFLKLTIHEIINKAKELSSQFAPTVQEGKQVYEWVKANERLPIESGQYCIREMIHGKLCYSVDYFGAVGRGNEFYDRMGGNDYEWLSRTTLPAQVEGYTDDNLVECWNTATSVALNKFDVSFSNFKDSLGVKKAAAQGYTLKQVGDAYDAGFKRGLDQVNVMKPDGQIYPDKATYLSSISPAQDSGDTVTTTT